MNTGIHLNFNGNCDEAFTFYEKAFHHKRRMSMTYAEAPAGTPLPSGMDDKVLHTALQLGDLVLMGCDAPADRSAPLGGFQISVSSPEEAHVRQWFAALSEGGSITMPLTPTFWSPLFGMCTDKFGVAWMVSVHPPHA